MILKNHSAQKIECIQKYLTGENIMSIQPSNTMSSQKLNVTVEWSPAPAKQALKEGCGVYAKVVATSMETGLKVGARVVANQHPQYASLLGCADKIIEVTSKKAEEAYKACADSAIDKAYESPDSIASRADRYFGYDK